MFGCATFVQRASDVQRVLQKYHRSQIESGRLFEEHRFGSDNRADQALIRDLGKVREALIADGLEVEYAHALIGRSIFVRYLEDRGILVEEYFREVAAQHPTWDAILDAAPPAPAGSTAECLYYAAILRNKGFTDALFDRLAEDFNGDLFPFGPGERHTFTSGRLGIVRRFLLGEIEGDRLFFFAYDFRVIPIELISSIYEEFLKVERGKANTQGSFYTPAALVEFVLSHTLTRKVMQLRPRVVDPACGSAIFLVEAFRRLVRHRVSEVGRRLRPDELRRILREQIAGVDVNPEAVRVAAFSLYLALLHYLEPPDILHHELPHLTYAERATTDPADHFDILLAANAFGVDGAVPNAAVRRRFAAGSADVVVGNPPWGEPKEQDERTKQAAATVAEWCAKRKRDVGDKELSQAFVHLAMEMLKPGGRAGLLLSTGVFFKRHEKSRLFRQQWLGAAAVQAVVNFAAVRHVFFTGHGRSKGAIAPFAAVTFTKLARRRADHHFDYYSAKQTAIVDRLQVVSLKRHDLHRVRQASFMSDDDLWKVYWWGGHRDHALVDALRAEDKLLHVVDPEGQHPERIGEGVKESKKNRRPAKNLHKYQFLPTDSLTRYGPVPQGALTAPPANVERERDPAIYEGTRILVKRGITQKAGTNGQIVARLATEPLCFRHSIYGVRLVGRAERDADVILGIFWSSVTRYFAWMTAGSWGMWHHEVLKETIERVPMRLPEDSELRGRITRTVRDLRKLDRAQYLLFSSNGDGPAAGNTRIARLERKLDDAVFDLFELTDADRDLVRDMCEVGLPFFYNGSRAAAVKPVPVQSGQLAFGTLGDLPRARHKQSWIDGYVHAFLETWQPELEPHGRFRYRVIYPGPASPMLAVVFSTEAKGTPRPKGPTADDQAAWAQVLTDLGKSSRQGFGSAGVYIDGMTRIVRPNEIVIIKQNEQRLWTRTAARGRRRHTGPGRKAAAGQRHSRGTA